MANVSTANDSVLDWAVNNFGFDLNDRRSRQDGVAKLQEWLNENGADIAADGILGPQTLALLEKVYESQQKVETDVDDVSEAPENFNSAYSQEFEKKGGSKYSKDFEQKVKGRNAPFYSEESASKAPEEEPRPKEKEKAVIATASPVALSDSAIEDVSQDRLDFRPYIEAVAEFILAEQTRPPLAIAVNARWGQGKTSFMNMLDGQLKLKADQTTTRVATTWFNPWKYSEPAQVWAAFIANVTRCLNDNLTRGQSWRFRWDRYRSKWHRHADLALVMRIVVAVAFFAIVGSLAIMDWDGVQKVIAEDYKLFGAFYASMAKTQGGFFWYIPIGFGLLLSLIYLYITFTKKIGLNLLEYVEKTDFRDKIGTLSQFESEMHRLADAVPSDLKVVVFIDDLDRCKGQVLGEIIEALQLADVSRTCVFVMGMDLQIVSSAIEKERTELTNSTGGNTHMEHGSGYKFLEKIIQARLSLPSHGEPEMKRLVKAAMGSEGMQGDEGSDVTGTSQNKLNKETDKDSVLQLALGKIGLGDQAEKETPKDSQELIDLASYYGSRHFSNPRRLKRFINGFRLQAYLANAVQPVSVQIDRLARFLILAEKWPALLNYLVQENKGAEVLSEKKQDGKKHSMREIREEILRLRADDHERVIELLKGRQGKDPLTAELIQSLASWCGFFYYQGATK
jgi:hypothetical protein